MNCSVPLYLASGSPRRFELLQLLEYPFEVIRPQVPEVQQPDELAHQYVRRLAKEKALAGQALLIENKLDHTETMVLGADTIVVVDGDVLEKPENYAHYRDMMERLRGRSHQVMTAVAIARNDLVKLKQVTTEVTFCHLSDEQISQYWASGEPVDKAGGYGIQGRGGRFVEHIRGSYFAVVGLPLYETEQLIKQVSETV